MITEDYKTLMMLSDENYYADRQFLSNSSLKMLRESPTKFDQWRKGIYRQPDTSAFALGKAVHSMFLEGVDTAVLCEIRRDKRTQEYRDLLDASYGKNLLTASEYKDYEGMVKKLQSIEEVNNLIDGGVPELAGFANLYGLDFKAKADMIIETEDLKYLVDLKTSAKPLDEFYRSARYLLYNQQAYLYQQIFGIDHFIFVVVEKSYPYEVGIFECSDEFLTSGRLELEKSVEMYKELFINNEYNPNSARGYTL